MTNGACTVPFVLVDPDSTWRCSCSCGSGSAVTMTGCALASSSTAGAACPQVCAGSPCGNSLTCSPSACTAVGTGTLVSTQTCAVSDGRPPGAAPSSRGDYTASASSASNAVVRAAGQAATTPVPGQIVFSATTSPPVAGSGIELAFLDLHPADVFLGGSVNAFVRNIAVVHPARVHGVFTDSTHFTLDPGKLGMVVTLQTQPMGGIMSTPLNVQGGNPAAMTGTLDLVTGTFALDGTAADASGNGLDLHFRGSITSRPPDANHNGIIDAVDKCPGATVGPDRSPPPSPSCRLR